MAYKHIKAKISSTKYNVYKLNRNTIQNIASYITFVTHSERYRTFPKTRLFPIVPPMAKEANRFSELISET